MSRSARERRTFFIEEPLAVTGAAPTIAVRSESPGLFVCTPQLDTDLGHAERVAMQRELVDRLWREQDITPEVLWFYTPMALPFARHLSAPVTVYDCMDELSAFTGAPPELPVLERELFDRAQLVFTGGHALHRAKSSQHASVHAFPSSVDCEHFRKARAIASATAASREPARPCIGFYGVIDERLDYDLIASIADRRPDWQLELVGPVAKVDPAALPRRPNLRWLGQKSYTELPAQVAQWDVAIMPFALNRATRFISPTKTLEYLAAGLPVVSTAIEDVVEPYGRAGIVAIADRESFVAAIEDALAPRSEGWRAASEAVLAGTSWDRTWSRMKALIDAELERARDALSDAAPQRSGDMLPEEEEQAHV